MKTKQIAKRFTFLFVLLLISTMLVSCQAIGAALGAFFSFVFFLLIALAGLVGGIILHVKGLKDSGEVCSFFSVVCYWVFVFSLSKLIGFVPRPLLIIAIIAQFSVLLPKWDELSENYGTFWLIIASTLCSLTYVFGFLNTHIISLPYYSLTLTLSPAILIFLSCIIAIFPSILVMDTYSKWLYIIYTLFPLLGLTFSSIMGSSFWWIVLGFGSGCVLFIILSSIESSRQARIEAGYIAEIERQKKAEAERKRLEREEYERNRPIQEKLAELESQALAVYEENSAKLKEAKTSFAQTKSNFKEMYGHSNIDKTLQEYIDNSDDDKAFNPSFWDAFFSSGVNDAQERVKELQNIAMFYADRYNISAVKAKLENDIYTANRKKAVLFAERLKDIRKKLTEKQKQRKIEDIGETLNINGRQINISNSIGNIKSFENNFFKERISITEYAKGYNKFIKETKITDNKTALTALGVTAIIMIADWAITNYEERQKQKKKLLNEQKQLLKRITNIEKGRVQAEGFSKRVGELNRIIEGAMRAYETIFVDVYNSLYPSDDVNKSKNAREENEKNGGYYFNDEEVKAVLKLGFVGQSLLQLADTNFEGE